MCFVKKTGQRLSCMIFVLCLTVSSFTVPTFAVEQPEFVARPVDYVLPTSYSDSKVYSNGTILDVENTDITLEDFKAMLADSENEDYIGLCNFDNDSRFVSPGSSSSTWINVLNMKYGLNSNKKISLTHTTVYTPYNANTEKAQFPNIYFVDNEETTSPGKSACFPCSDPTLNGTYYYEFSPMTGSSELESLKYLGFVLINYVDIDVTAYFKTYEGEEMGEKTLSAVKAADATETPCSFFGFVAPEGQYIYKLWFEINSSRTWPAIDDICFVSERRPRPASVVTNVEITAPDSIDIPPYRSSYTYPCSINVLNQYQEPMEDEEMEINISHESVAIEDGVLTIRQMDSMPESVTITATSVTDPAKTETKTITVNQKSPFYNADTIGQNDGNPDYLMEEFSQDMLDAIADPDKDIAFINFEGDDVRFVNGTAYAPLNSDPSKSLMVVSESRNFGKVETIDGKFGGTKVTTSSGTIGTMFQPISVQKNIFNFDCTELGDRRVTAFGYAQLSYTEQRTSAGFGIYVTFSDGTIGFYSKDSPGGGTVNKNVFYGIKAPAGMYITSIKVELEPARWTMADDFGFIIEKPDTIPLERDFGSLIFSSFSSQDMKNIRESVNLPRTLGEGSTVAWEAAPTGVINTTTGELTIPDTPDKSNVVLTANVTHGALTKKRVFKLYAPSKLELDAKELGIPQTTDKNLTLPSVGSKYGSRIVWSSDDKSLISDEGNVSRPKGRDKYCVLTATLSNDGGSMTVDFPVTVSGTVRDNSSGGGSSGGGGGGGFVTMLPAVSTPKTPYEVMPEDEVIYSKTFKDLSIDHWAHDAIIELNKKGIVNGTGNGDFEPEGKVTREQYLAMLVRAFDFSAEESSTQFSDVDADSWCADAINVAASLGISNGYADGSFGVGREITREEMAVMAYRAALIKGADFTETACKEWADAASISEFAKKAVFALNNKGIINGISSSEFSPKTNTTRAQAAVIIMRLLEVDYAE